MVSQRKSIILNTSASIGKLHWQGLEEPVGTMLSVHPSLLVDMRKQAIVLCVDRIDSLRNEGKTLEGILDGRTAWEIMDDNFEPTVMSAVPGILVAFQPPVAANDILLALVLCSHQGRYTVGIHSSIYKLLKQGIQRLTCTVTMNEVVTDAPHGQSGYHRRLRDTTQWPRGIPTLHPYSVQGPSPMLHSRPVLPAASTSEVS